MLKKSLSTYATVAVVLASVLFCYMAYIARETVGASYDIAQSEAVSLSEVDDALHLRQHARQEKAKHELVYKALVAPDIAAFDKSSTAYLIRHIATQKPVVFLTIDDGLTKNPDAIDYITANRLNPTLFLTDKLIQDNYAFFNDYKNAGVTIQNHTLTHPNMRKQGYGQQRQEVCGQSEKLMQEYGSRPTLFRPPYGEFNSDTLRAAHDCGINFVVHWSATVDGGMMHYQTGNHLKAGDIVLMHFRPAMMDDLRAFNDEATSQGLTPAYLSDWLR